MYNQIFLLSDEGLKKAYLSSAEFFSGWMAGIAGLIASHPLDTIKVVAQEGRGTTWDAAKRIYKEWGYMGYYKGVLVPAMMAGVQNAIFFGAFANTYRHVPHRDPDAKHANDNELGRLFISGNVGGLVQVIMTTPVEVIKIRLQTEHSQHSNLFVTVRHMWRHGGVHSFYRGFLPTIVRDVPTGGLYIAIYTFMDHWLDHYIGSYWAHCFAGGSAGLLSYMPALPADVIKTRLQADSLRNPIYKSLRECVRTTWRKDGPGFFFQGFLPYCIRAFFNNSVLFVVYEFCLNIF